jgi:DNA-binding response OmpR family regulator
LSPEKRILVVDDDADVAGMAALVLRRAGYQVTTVNSGDAALVQAVQISYDLILLDINMPGMDGWEVLRVLKADESTAGTPVAMFTIRGEVRDKVHGLQEGAFDYITKPFSVDELRERVALILNRNSATATQGS